MTATTGETTNIEATRTYLSELAGHVQSDILSQLELATSTLQANNVDQATLGDLATIREQFDQAVTALGDLAGTITDRHGAVEEAVNAADEVADTDWYRHQTASAPVATTLAPVAITGRIAAAYRLLADRPGEPVALADLRMLIGEGVERIEVDLGLLELAADPGIRLLPADPSPALTRQDRLAAIRIAGEERHQLVIAADHRLAVPPGDASEGGPPPDSARGTGLTPAQVKAVPPLQWHYATRALDAASRARLARHGDLGGWDHAEISAAVTAYRYDKTGVADPSRAAEPAVNAALRGTHDLDQQRTTVIAALDTALAASRIPCPITVYRGFSNGVLLLPDDWQRRDLVGLGWADPAFTSVTADPAAAEAYAGPDELRGFAVRLHLPTGTPAIAIHDDPDGLDDEGEIVLTRGLAFTVTADFGPQGEYGIRWLEVAALGVAAPRLSVPGSRAKP
jgi:hypothetical protein